MSAPPPTTAVSGLALAAGRYRLVSPLGSGGFGRVWLARDHRLNVDVAIKEVYVPPGSTPEETAERVERAAWEARHAAQLRDHPNVVAVHDVVVERGVPWTVMQYVSGRSLADEIRQNGPVDRGLVKRVGLAMLAALGACHQAGIMHRDVKPANIMLAKDGTVMLTDFGIAKQVGQSSMTRTDLVIGSMEYIAPERARGHPATPATDLFSLGVTLYHAAEGVSPFGRGSGMASLSAVLLDELPEPVRAGERLTWVIEGLTAKNPVRRMTAHQAAAILRGGDNTTRPRPKPDPTVKDLSAAKATATPALRPAKTTTANPETHKPSAARRIMGFAAGTIVLGSIIGALAFHQQIWAYIESQFVSAAPAPTRSMESIEQGECFTIAIQVPTRRAVAKCDKTPASDLELWQVVRRFDTPTAICSPASTPSWPETFVDGIYPGDYFHRMIRPADGSYILCVQRRYL
ncbi:serine/threonine-protein kinase [Streptomyces sp. NPDC101490]|uniref:serine/threonine-protein kinase n=1 Tax=Streptomyces sp. NPDC101490 TaxID=3366143 RepID=UPI003816BDDE